MIWSYILTAVGVLCFWLAGKKVWYAWYIGLAGQVLWVVYALISDQYGFLFGSVFYTAIYIKNAIAWTKGRHEGR